MKKMLLAFSALLVLSVISLYILIPANLVISKSEFIRCNPDAAYRVLSNQNTWSKWWPGNDSLLSDSSGNSNTLTYQKETYKPGEIFLNRVDINISHNKSSVNSSIITIPLNTDSVITQWQCTIVSSHNPFKRIAQYWHAVNIKKNMDSILKNMSLFLENPENVYGIRIKENSTKDTLLVAVKSLLHHSPSIDDIYNSVNALKQYAQSHGAEITSQPMLNISSLDSNQFQMMVALPINKKLSGNGNILFKQMIPGNFLTTTVTGGPSAVANAQKQLVNFMNDYHKTSMAIPFQVLITDRNTETDTTEWVTKLFEPVMK